MQLLTFQQLRVEFLFLTSSMASVHHTKFRRLRFGIIRTLLKWLIRMLLMHSVAVQSTQCTLFFVALLKTEISSSSTERLVTHTTMHSLLSLKSIWTRLTKRLVQTISSLTTTALPMQIELSLLWALYVMFAKRLLIT